MTFWNGTRWVNEAAPATPPRPSRPRARDWLATSLMVIVLAGLLVPFVGTSAKTLPGNKLIATWSESYGVRTFQEGSSRIKFHGKWRRATHREYLGDWARFAVRSGATASLRFTGTGVAWVGPVGPTRGSAKVYVNGRYIKTVNTYSPHFKPTQVLFTATFSTVATRTLTVAVVGTEGHATVAIDAFVVRGRKKPPKSDGEVITPPPAATTLPTPNPTVPPDPTVAPTATAGATPSPMVTPRPTGSPTVTPAPTPTVTASPSPAPTHTPTLPPPTPPPATWSDDFSSGLSQWTPKVHTFNAGYRTAASQVSVSAGVLNLTSVREGPGAYVSGTVYSDRTFDRGYFEARIKWPKGTGFDCAFWLYPEGRSTPAPEIDIIEAYPNEPYVWPGPNRYQATMHYVSGGVSRNHQITHDAGQDLTDQWHIVGANWIPGQRLEFYLDGTMIGSITADVLPATSMNVMFSQILATWSAPPDATTPASATMQVDWVRWYESKP